MLTEINSNRLMMGQCQALWSLGPILSILVAEGRVQVADSSKYVTFEIKDEVVWESLLRRPHLYRGRF